MLEEVLSDESDVGTDKVKNYVTFQSWMVLNIQKAIKEMRGE